VQDSRNPEELAIEVVNAPALVVWRRGHPNLRGHVRLPLRHFGLRHASAGPASGSSSRVTARPLA
jgi:hypothetical protein